jgi:hypothetical protein
MRHKGCWDLVFLHISEEILFSPASTAGRVRIMRFTCFQRLYGHCDFCIGFPVPADLQKNHIILFIVSTSNCWFGVMALMILPPTPCTRILSNNVLYRPDFRLK